jgi:hypothetical protein
MHRYYFDLRDDRGLFVDDEGLQCSDLKAVQTEAARTLADMARDAVHIAGSSPPHMMSIEVRDDGGPVMQIAGGVRFDAGTFGISTDCRSIQESHTFRAG